MGAAPQSGTIFLCGSSAALKIREKKRRFRGAKPVSLCPLCVYDWDRARLSACLNGGSSLAAARWAVPRAETVRSPGLAAPEHDAKNRLFTLEGTARSHSSLRPNNFSALVAPTPASSVLHKTDSCREVLLYLRCSKQRSRRCPRLVWVHLHLPHRGLFA